MNSRFYLSLMLISSLVLMAFLAIAFNREMTPVWKDYQTEYKETLIKNAKDDGTRERAEKIQVGLQQIYIKALNKSDRCTSCHAGVENPLMAAAEVPYKQHSGNYLKNHPLPKFGCTLCHRGQGRALNIAEAHGEEHQHWDFPIVPAKYIQSSCASCHDYKMLETEGGEKVAKGEKLFREKGCLGCHKLNGVGGALGKDIAGIANKAYYYFSMAAVVGERNMYSWIKQHFDDPRKIVPESQMRAFLTDEEADLLTTYMLTFRTDEMPRSYRLIKNIDKVATDGKSMYTAYCSACHSDGKTSVYDEIFARTIPAIRNPSFLKTISNSELKRIVKEGRKGTQMTAWKSEAAGLTEKQIDEIVKYVAKDRPSEKSRPFNVAKIKSDIERGAEIYNNRCALCHGEEGKGGENLLGMTLRDSALSPEFIAITVRDGRKGTPMVPFGNGGIGLSNQEIADTVAYVKNLTNDKK